jgi:hypothetical protein
MTPNHPSTTHAVQYLLARGIDVTAAVESGLVEISANGSPPRGVYRARLGFDVWNNKLLPDIVQEAIWFEHKDNEGTVQSYSVRVFPELPGKEGSAVKFLGPRDGDNFPFIPRETWEVAAKPNHPVVITEGPIKSIAILQAGGLPIGVNGVWSATRNVEGPGTELHPVLAENFQWRGRKAYLGFDQDFETNPSVRQALARTLIVLHERAAEATIIRWPIAEGKGVDDYLASKIGGSIDLPKIFNEMCQASVPLSGILKSIDLEFVELELLRSRLRGVALDQLCRLIAKPLVVRASTLFEQIQEERRKLGTTTPQRDLSGIIPRSLPILLEALIEVLKRYVTFLFPDEQPIIIALWIIQTWLFAAFDYMAYLDATSPAKRSGKSRLLETLQLLCRNPEKTEGATAAALIRLISETDPPTFLLDELDTVYKHRGGEPEAENMRRFLNAGFKRGATFYRCGWQGKEIIVEKVPAFCPKALASIGQCLPDTVTDRSIPIEIHRQDKENKAQKMRDREAGSSVAKLRDELEVLSQNQELLEVLNKARPKMPDELNDRQQDICEPLLAIADHAGKEWAEKARAALVKLYGRQEDECDLSLRLLADIKHVFDGSGEEKLPTQILLEKLVAIATDQPWADWFEKALKDGQVKSAGSKLARYLKPYGIKPIQVWIDDRNEKGYQRNQFEKTWERYLLPGKENFSASGNLEARKARNSSIPVIENDLSPSLLVDKATSETSEKLADKSLGDKGVTEIPSLLASESAGPEKKSENPRVGDLSEEELLNFIRQPDLFPNAKIILPEDEKSKS